LIGSGVVEAGGKKKFDRKTPEAIGHALERGANSTIALRCCLEPGGFESRWQERGAD